MIQRQPQNKLLTKQVTEKSYNDIGIRNSIPDFQPHREQEGNLERLMHQTAKEVVFLNYSSRKNLLLTYANTLIPMLGQI